MSALVIFIYVVMAFSEERVNAVPIRFYRSWAETPSQSFFSDKFRDVHRNKFYLLCLYTSRVYVQWPVDASFLVLGGGWLVLLVYGLSSGSIRLHNAGITQQ